MLRTAHQRPEGGFEGAARREPFFFLFLVGVWCLGFGFRFFFCVFGVWCCGVEVFLLLIGSVFGGLVFGVWWIGVWFGVGLVNWFDLGGKTLWF